MATFSQRNVQQVLVGHTANYDAGSAINTLAAGEVAVFTPQGVRVPTVASVAPAGVLDVGDRFKVAVGTGLADNPVIVSDVIDPSTIKSMSSRAAKAAEEQIDYIGFNGTSGSIDVIDDNLYFLELYVQDYLTSNTDGRKIKHAQYLTGQGETEMEIAVGLEASLYENFYGRNNEADKFVASALMSASPIGAGSGEFTAFTALTASATGVTILNGSKNLTVDVAIDGDGLAVGDYVRIDESNGDATAIIDPIYKVVALDTTNEIAVLDRPYQGTSISGDAAANVAFAVGADLLASAYAGGVRLTGQPLKFQVGKFQYNKARWELNLLIGENTTITNAQAADEGSGTQEQVAELEWFTQGHEGEYFRMGEPAIHPARALASDAAGYDMYEITFADVSVVGFQNNHSPKHLSIADGQTAGDSISNANGAAAIIEAITGLSF